MPTYKTVIVPQPDSQPVVRLVDGKNEAQVIRFVAKQIIQLSRVSPKECYELAKQGIELEDATQEPDNNETP